MLILNQLLRLMISESLTKGNVFCPTEVKRVLVGRTRKLGEEGPSLLPTLNFYVLRVNTLVCYKFV